VPLNPGDLQTSAAYVGALGRALKTLGHLEEVVSKCSPGAARMLRSPQQQPWWPTEEFFSMTDAMAATGGPALLQQVGRLAVFESMSPIVRPLVAALLALSGPSPATLLSRFSQLTSAAIKNVRFEWTATGPTSGSMLITYPVPVPVHYLPLWEGAFDFVWTATKRIGSTRSRYDGTRLHFELSWSA
jgi:hypothetical protein